MSKRSWLTTFMACVIGTTLSTIAVAQKSVDLSGKWTVDRVTLKGGEAIGITEQNCTWCGHYKTTVPIQVSKDQKVSYQFEGQAKSAIFRAQGDNRLKVLFLDSPDLPKDGSVDVFSMYEFRMDGDGFVLSRQDPAIAEVYHFKRIP